MSKTQFINIFALIALFLLTGISFYSCDSLKKNDTTEIIFVGDLLLDRGVRERIDHLGIESLFDTSIDSVFTTANIVVANLECPATKIEEPIHKKYIFRAEPEWLAVLKNHGITHLNLANNHSMDQGRKGLINTHKIILENNLVPLGYGENHKSACSEKLISTEPRNTYLLSSLQVPSENWVFLEDKPCVCEESFGAIAERIQIIKNREPNAIVIVQLHWGAEHTLTPLTSQKQQAYTLVEAGADAIIGHHPHTIQTIEQYKGKPIYYSLGNFIFDQSNKINSKGLMVRISIKKKDIKYEDILFKIENCKPRIE